MEEKRFIVYSVEVPDTPRCEAAGGKETSMISRIKVGAVTPGAAPELARASWWVVFAPAAVLL